MTAVAARPPGPPRLLGGVSLVLLAAAVAYGCLPLPWPVNRFDEGIHLCGAELVRAGRVPYADFQTLYTPGSYYLLAAAFSAAGATFDTWTGVNVLLVALNAWAGWHVACRAGAGRLAAGCAFAAGLAVAYPYPALVLALAATVCASRGSLRAACAGGVLAGFAGWFRQDLGAVAALAGAASAAVAAEGRWTRRAARGAAVGAAAAAALALLLAPSLSAPREVWRGLVVNPLATVAHRNSADDLGAAVRDPAFALPVAVAVLAVAAATAGAWFAARRGERSRAALLAGLGVIGAWCLRYVVLRADPHHLVPAAVVGTALLPASAAVATARWVRAAAACATVLAVAFPGARSAAAHVRELAGRRDARVAGVGDLLPGARTLHLAEDEAPHWVALVRDLRSRLGPGETFLSACARHDRIHDQDLLLYFAVGTLPPAHDYHFDPGVTTRADVQQGIVDDAESAGVRVVVRFRSWTGGGPERDPGGAVVLDEWIASRFRPVARHGRYEVWVR